MEQFQFTKSRLSEVRRIHPFCAEDNRGLFVKTYESECYIQNGITGNVTETFFTKSKQRVIHGMHFQTENPQEKIISVIQGSVYDVLVDLRRDSKTFGQWEGFELSADDYSTLFVPKGFAHGYMVRSEISVVLYQCIGKYDSASDSGIRWNDPNLGICWNEKEPIISERDKNLMTFLEFVNKYKGL